MIWKEDGSAVEYRVRDCLLSFGLSRTAEDAMGKVERAMRYGTTSPLRSPEEFRRMFKGGVFYPIRTDFGVPCP